MAKKKNDWEYVEVKTGNSKQTKSEKEFEKECNKKGNKYSLQYEDPFFY